MMKKRERKGQARKRTDDSDDEPDKGGDNAGTEDIKRKTLEQIREEQRQRKVRMGLQAASTLDTGEEEKQKKKKGARAQGSDGEEEDEEAAKANQKTIGERMESNFTGIKYMAKRDEGVAHKKIMEEYIQEKMGIKSTSEDPNEGASSGKLSMRDKLLQITREIQPEMPQDTNKDESGVGEGAPIAYSTGIAEVSLPIDVRLRNIEETERARRTMEELQKMGAIQPDMDPSIIGNLTTNYHLFRKDHAEKMREKDMRERERSGQTQGQQGRGQQQGRENTGYKGKNSMTDDMVYERFKKRARR